ncbi:1-deoxy-D-xylulose-5-phosphate reductoisomerase [Bacillus sp. FJAT-44742]|uniref:1-deoxy-D-xylulose-5-phosphate reductoisomerase n=1 Tax=Bacillus sp. FJAT-44742 TaxID=2014005 RepID=UPI000C250433|nr:1-deoxy-D-xylulose-5-phosphate reductoisomerase [Bacillus sp. FJAT-44742]
MKHIALLGSTGSIGTQTLDIIRTHPDKFSLVSMSAGRNTKLAISQINEFKPETVSVAEEKDAEKIRAEVPAGTNVVYGGEGLKEVAVHPEADFLMNAVLGSVGLEPTLAAIEAGKVIGIANKETLVTAGHIVMEKAKENNVQVLPVDSEHSAIFQCLEGSLTDEVSRLILTASGGSFRDLSRNQLSGVTVEDALNHPNWSMGAKITIDSATMMNKGLEVIEAHWLFGIAYEQIEVLLHRESIIHSLVEYQDGSVLAQLGTPDMRVPIQYALSYPKRLELKDTKRLNLWEAGTLDFKQPDFKRYKCLQYAFDAGKEGGTMPVVLNAANEVAVEAFLQKSISFLGIEDVIEEAMNRHSTLKNPSLDTILQVDQETREYVRTRLN